MTTTLPATDRKTPHPAIALAGMVLGLGAILVLLLALFILPSLKSGPHDLRLGLVGTPSAVAQTQQSLTALDTDAYDVVTLSSPEALHQAVRDREVVGGLVVTEDAVEAIVASAGSTAISGSITATATQLAAPTQAQLTVTDVVALPESDPTGIGVGGLAFPLVFGGIVPVVAFASIFPRSNTWRLSGIVAFAGLGGVLVAAVLQYWFGSVTAAFWPVTGAMALGIAALALPLAGLQKLFGAKGFTAGAMAMMFLGNPLAGIGTTGAWLPTGLGTFGQLLPPGATGALVRSVAYFDGAGALAPALTLTAWVLAGMALSALGIRRATKDAD